ncbi:MAG: NeuD/PglB/VioB family sugar acetyltransferase [Opitutaceae bacterium]
MIIIGAKGLAKELLTALSWNGSHHEICFFDDVSTDIPDLLYDRFRVFKSWDDLGEYFSSKDPRFTLGVGDPHLRATFAGKAVALGGELTTVISKHALIGEFGVNIEPGVGILSNSTITIDVTIGRGCLVNKMVILSHDSQIGQFCNISPGARILGEATVGDRTEIGTNAVILPGVQIGSDCKVGAGAVVTRDVPNGSNVAGIPAKEMRSNDQ